MPPAITWLIRHGQSTANAGMRATGQNRTPLTALGRRQASKVAELVNRPPDLLIVSPFERALASAQPIRDRWPRTPCETWPIQELTYLSPERCRGTTAEARRPWIETYWDLCDPGYRDGPDAESFESFMSRLLDFQRRLLSYQDDFTVVVGHGQFFRAYLMGLQESFVASREWMKRYRATETARPIANCQIIELTREALASCQA